MPASSSGERDRLENARVWLWRGRFLGGLKMFVLSWRAGRQGDPPLERPYQLTTILPIRKSVTETWLFKERETAKDSAWRAASGWLQFHAAEVK